MNNPELPLDPNLQTSNLLITFLKYASIVMQDTKGKQKPLSLCFYIILILSLFHLCPELSYLSCLRYQCQIHAFITQQQGIVRPSLFYKNNNNSHVFVFSDEHRLNSARLCLIILTCIAEVGTAYFKTNPNSPGICFQILFVLTTSICVCV